MRVGDMKCSVHYLREAAGRCYHCGSAVCNECLVVLGGKGYCLNCGEEEVKMLALRSIVDTAAFWIQSGTLSRHQADSLIERAKDEVLEVFPGKGELFELIYRPRLNRLVKEFAGRFG